MEAVPERTCAVRKRAVQRSKGQGRRPPGRGRARLRECHGETGGRARGALGRPHGEQPSEGIVPAAGRPGRAPAADKESGATVRASRSEDAATREPLPANRMEGKLAVRARLT